MTNPTKIKLQIGTYTVEFVAMTTTAPKEYDGFGTIHIYPDEVIDSMIVEGRRVPAKTERIVLVDTEHQTWQIGRYGSGLYSAEECDALDTYIQNHLLQRIRGQS